MRFRIPLIFAPIWQAIGVLCGLLLLVLLQDGRFVPAEVIHFAEIFGFGIVLFVALRFLTGVKKAPEALFITLALLFLLIEPLATTWTFSLQTALLFAIVAVAVTSKYFLEVAGRPIVNPAVLGILFGIFVSNFIPGVAIDAFATRLTFDQLFVVGGISVSWVALLLAVWIFWGLPKWDRTTVITAFFLAAAFLIFFRDGSVGVGTFFSTSPFLYLFAAFVLTDPKTSPDDHLWQWGFGACVALLLFALQTIFVQSPLVSGETAFYIALALANIGLVLVSAWRFGR